MRSARRGIQNLSWALCLLAGTAFAEGEPVPQFVTDWGRWGSEFGAFEALNDIATAPDGSVYAQTGTQFR